MSIKQTVAEYYVNDARHFIHRYRLLPLEEFNKAGRVKNFMDVVMAAECALKAHIFLGASDEDLVATYRQIRKMSHDVSRLADSANFLGDRSGYEAVKARLGELSIGLRYSLDMWETYFPSFGDDGPTRTYDTTLANTNWRNEAISEVEFLIDALRQPPVVIDDFELVFGEMEQMEKFARAIGLRN